MKDLDLHGFSIHDAWKEFKRRCDAAELQAYMDVGTERQAQNAALQVMERRVLRAGGSQERADQFLLDFMSETLK